MSQQPIIGSIVFDGTPRCTAYHTVDTSDAPEGLFDLPMTGSSCPALEHLPPTLLYIPPGKGYRHRCPACGLVTTVIPSQVSL